MEEEEGRGAEAEDAVVGRPREVRALHSDIHYWIQSAESLRLLSLAPFKPIPLSSIIPSSATSPCPPIVQTPQARSPTMLPYLKYQDHACHSCPLDVQAGTPPASYRYVPYAPVGRCL